MATIANWLLPVLKFLKPRLITVEDAAKPVVDVAVAGEFKSQEGYYEGRAKVDSSLDSMDEEMQKVMWERSVVWCELAEKDTIIVL